MKMRNPSCSFGSSLYLVDAGEEKPLKEWTIAFSVSPFEDVFDYDHTQGQ